MKNLEKISFKGFFQLTFLRLKNRKAPSFKKSLTATFL